MRNRREPRGIFFALLLVVFVTVSLAFTLLPFVLLLIESVTPPNTGLLDPTRYQPGNFSFANYRRLLELGDVTRFFINSLAHALGYTALSLVLNSLAAYAFARIVFPGRDRLFTFLVLTMMVPSQVIMIPIFLIVKSFGMLNTYLGLIVPGCAHVYGIFTLRQFMLEIPRDLFDAARVDGCGEFQVFRHIALPLCRPMLATLAVTSFIYTWDQFLFPLVIMQDEAMFTLPVALVSLANRFAGDWGVVLAGGVVTALPALLVFALGQRYYVAGITAGAVKK